MHRWSHGLGINLYKRLVPASQTTGSRSNPFLTWLLILGKHSRHSCSQAPRNSPLPRGLCQPEGRLRSLCTIFIICCTKPWYGYGNYWSTHNVGLSAALFRAILHTRYIAPSLRTVDLCTDIILDSFQEHIDELINYTF